MVQWSLALRQEHCKVAFRSAKDATFAERKATVKDIAVLQALRGSDFALRLRPFNLKF